MTRLPPLIQGNVLYLQQAEQLVKGLTDHSFTNDDLPPFNSSVGKHVRHILDFYHSFLSCSQDRIDYDLRQRDARVETDRQTAIDRIRAIRNALVDVRNLDAVAWSSNDEGAGGDGNDGFLKSSIGRELQFLASHTIHHFAMIAYLLNAQSIAVPDAFGVAPSTLAHRQESENMPQA